MSTITHAQWMQRCLQLAALGADRVAPNPMVGAVLVQGDRMLAEGWHHLFGGPHAEVDCLHAFGDGPIPADATLYVNLEPCAHQGKTPPCADLLVRRGVKNVVIGQRDPFPAVAGKGIAILKAAGITVLEDVLGDECRWAQRRFLVSVEQGRPYIVLKWARSQDGYLDREPSIGRRVQRISGPATDVLVHRWRSMEQSILVGSRTVVNDDPSLTVRHVAGRQPLRLVIDRKGITPALSSIYAPSSPTLLLTGHQRPELDVEQIVLTTTDDPIDRLLEELHRRGIRSVLVEGGAELHRHFLGRGLWDEARVITGTSRLEQGTPAPDMQGKPAGTVHSAEDRIDLYLNSASPVLRNIQYDRSWAW